jgi:trimeric autotransporter adhesin
MTNSKTRLAVLLLSTLCLSPSAYGQFTPSGNAYTNGAKPTKNYAGSEYLFVGEGTNDTAYIQFDLSAIPTGYTGANVAQATLKLYIDAVTLSNGSFDVYFINGSWSEDTITYNNAPPLGAPIVSGITLTSANSSNYININITPALVAWLNGTPNDGIALVASRTGPVFALDTKENTVTSHSPELDVVFAEGGGTLTGITTASGSGLTGGGTSGTLDLALTPCTSSEPILVWSASGWNCSNVSGGSGGITETGTITPNSLPLFSTTPNTVTSSNVFQSTNGNIGVGTQTPGAALDVNGSINAATGFNIGETPFAFGSALAENAFLGFAGGTALTTGNFDTAVGYQALFSDATGYSNTATGSAALYSNVGGSNNTASGLGALYSNIGGSYNAAFGVNALNDYPNNVGNTTGSFNTAVGSSSGQTLDHSNITTNNNTAVGAGAAFSTGTLTNATAIGSNAEVAESNALVLGAITGVGSGTSVNVGIGTTTPAATLDVEAPSGTPLVNFFGSSPTAGTFTVNGNTITGNLTVTGTCTGCGGGGSGGVTSVTGTAPISVSTSGGTATVSLNPIGDASVAATANINPTKIAGTAATLGINTFTGPQTVNGNLSATGVVTGSSYQIGSNLFAFGSYGGGNAFLGFAGSPNSSVLGDTAVGVNALIADTTGGNTAIGNDALDSSTGGWNTAIGLQALHSVTTGSFNTAIGDNAGNTVDLSNLTNGNDTAVGSGAFFSTGTLLNATAIGSNAVVSESNALVLGSINGIGYGASNVRVGIGTPAPAATLDVEAPSESTPSVNFFGSSSNAGNFTVNGNTSITGNLTVTGTCTGCGSGGGGGITGVTAGTGLTGGGTSGNVTLNVNQAVVAFQTDLSAGITTAENFATNAANTAQANAENYANSTFIPLTESGAFATLLSNSFNGSQSVTGNVSLTGTLTLPNTTSSTAGVVIFGKTPFVHNYPGGLNSYNTFVGASAGNMSMNTSSAIENTVVGASSFTNNTTGYNNSVFGGFALRFNTSGYQNNAFGEATLQLNTTGYNNNAFGEGALGANTTGTGNSGFGNSALSYNETGTNNTAVGNAALYQLGQTGATGGSSNIAVGFLAGGNYTGTESNNIDIGNQGTKGESNIINIGTTGVHTTANIAGILNTTQIQSPTGNLSIQGSSSMTLQSPTGSVQILAPTLSLSGGVTVTGNLNVSGTVTCGSGCSGGGGGGITSVTGTAPISVSTSGSTATVSLNPSDAISVESSAAGTSSVSGNNTATSGLSNGAYGSTLSPAGAGVLGVGVGNSNTFSTFVGTFPVGVWGDTNQSAAGFPISVSGPGLQASGVAATADVGIALLALNNAATGSDGDGVPTAEIYNLTADTTAAVMYIEGTSGGCIFIVSGALNCFNGDFANVVASEGTNRDVTLYAMQSPENWFEDFGSGQLKGGAATISLDPTFASTINTGETYHVFLTPNGDCKGLYVASKAAGGFEVRELGGGASSISFDYRIVAKRRGFENVRLADDTERTNQMRQRFAAMQARVASHSNSAAPHPAAPEITPKVPQAQPPRVPPSKKPLTPPQ